MTRYLLDTNIVSNAIKPHPAAAVTAWLGAQPDTDLHIASFTLAELRRGILRLPAGRRRRALEEWHDGPIGPPALFIGRIHAFDAQAADIWAQLMVEGERLGRPRDTVDMIIAATALAWDCVVVTANERDFRAVVPVVNPLHDPA